MSERITRPTVRLAGGLPDGNLSNLEALGSKLLSDDPPDVYALILLTRGKRIEDDDQDGAEQALLRTRAIEAIPDGKFPFAVAAGESVRDVLERLRADRTGVAMLPIATPAEAHDHNTAVTELREWAELNLAAGADGLAEEWDDYFGDRSPAGTVTSWRDAPPQMIAEFLAVHREAAADQAAFAASQTPDGPDGAQGGGDQPDVPVDAGEDGSGPQGPAVPPAEFTDAEPRTRRSRLASVTG